MLGAYKYADFFIETLNSVSGMDLGLLSLALPLAISFFTFQQIAFLVDRYKHEADEPGFVPYSLFVSFFAQRIAGPIVHHSEMIPRFSDEELRRWRSENVSRGHKAVASHGILLGVFKYRVDPTGLCHRAHIELVPTNGADHPSYPPVVAPPKPRLDEPSAGGDLAWPTHRNCRETRCCELAPATIACRSEAPTANQGGLS